MNETNQPVSDEFLRLQQHSAALGADPLQIQGAGGNSSIKQDGIMWIKASGKWLMHSVAEDIFVPVKHQALIQALHAGDQRTEKAIDFIDDAINPHGLRPSIETTLHAVMKQRVVIHVHCVDTIALAIRQDAQAQLDARLESFNWVFIPYVRPGLPLSRAIMARLGEDTDVLVLGNHGLVVAAESVAECVDLLERVRKAVFHTPRATATAHRLKPAVVDSRQVPGQVDPQCVLQADYAAAESPAAHAIAFDDIALNVAVNGSLYPDHVIFLGVGTVVAQVHEDCDAVVQRCAHEGIAKPVSIVFPGRGVAMLRSSTPGQQAMARCLSDVCLRVPDGAKVQYLDARQNHELLNWEAEQYRQTLNQGTT